MPKLNEVHLTKRADSGIYQATIDGQRISLGTRNRDEAIERAKEAKLPQLASLSKTNALTQHAIAALTAAPTPTAGEVLAMWQELREANGKSVNTIARDVSAVRQFLRSAKLIGTPVSKIDERPVGAFINEEGGNSAATRHRALACLRGFFEFALYRGYCRGNPAANVEVNYSLLSHEQKEPGKHEAFTEAQYERLIEDEILAGYPFLASATRIAYASGLRIGDIARLERACVGERGLAVFTEKTLTRVELPYDEAITPGLIEALHSVPANRTPYLFPEDREIHLDPNRRSRHSVYFKRILDRVGIKDRTFHGLRSTCARRWRGIGFSLEDCRVLLGHGSEAVTAGYTGDKKPARR